MRLKTSLLILALLLLLLSLVAAVPLKKQLRPSLSSSNVCPASLISSLHVGNLWILLGLTSLDTSTGTPVEIIPVKMLNINNLSLEVHPEHQFTFVAANGVSYPRAFGVPALTIQPGFTGCFTLGYKFVPGGSGSAQCPFDGAGLSYYGDQNHQQIAANWQLVWAPCG